MPPVNLLSQLNIPPDLLRGRPITQARQAVEGYVRYVRGEFSPDNPKNRGMSFDIAGFNAAYGEIQKLNEPQFETLVKAYLMAPTGFRQRVWDEKDREVAKNQIEKLEKKVENLRGDVDFFRKNSGGLVRKLFMGGSAHTGRQRLILDFPVEVERCGGCVFFSPPYNYLFVDYIDGSVRTMEDRKNLGFEGFINQQATYFNERKLVRRVEAGVLKNKRNKNLRRNIERQCDRGFFDTRFVTPGYRIIGAYEEEKRILGVGNFDQLLGKQFSPESFASFVLNLETEIRQGMNIVIARPDFEHNIRFSRTSIKAFIFRNVQRVAGHYLKNEGSVAGPLLDKSSQEDVPTAP